MALGYVATIAIAPLLALAATLDWVPHQQAPSTPLLSLWRRECYSEAPSHTIATELYNEVAVISVARGEPQL